MCNICYWSLFTFNFNLIFPFSFSDDNPCLLHFILEHLGQCFLKGDD